MRRKGRFAAAAGLAVVVLLGVLGVALRGADGSAATVPAPAARGGCAVVSPVVPGAAESKLGVRPLCALPAEAVQVWRQIQAGGPFRYGRDGITFGNFEGRLPAHQRGYYHEYTVSTPGESDRGARRLITGSQRELYFTADHYVSFVVVDAAATGS